VAKMPDLRTALARASSVGKKLDSATDALNSIILAAQEKIASLNLGGSRLRQYVAGRRGQSSWVFPDVVLPKGGQGVAVRDRVRT
jgi:hypothetical protein